MRIHRVGADADRYIAFHAHAYRVCICYGVLQLLVCVELQESVEVHRLFVALMKEDGIWLQPFSVLRKKCLELLAAEHSLFLGLENSAEVAHLLVVNVLIISVGQCIQLGLLFLVGLLQCGRQFAHFLDIDVYGVQREHRYCVVRVRVVVGVGEGSVVDRQRLNHLLSGGCGPVGKQFQVLELTDTEVILGAQREYRNSHAGTFPLGLRATEATVILQQNAFGVVYLTVLTILGVDNASGMELIDNVLIFNDICVCHDASGPDREFGIREDEFVPFVPVTQLGRVTDNSHTLRRQHLRCFDGKTNQFSFAILVHNRFGNHSVSTEQRVLEDGGKERFFVVVHLPKVAEYHFLVTTEKQQIARVAGLIDKTAVGLANSIFVMHFTCKIRHGNTGCPKVLTLTTQYQRMFLGPTQNGFCSFNYAEFLTPFCAIIDLKSNCHIVFVVVLF